ncbi:MAG TPA: hypothetical protein DHV41_05320 [Parachlamydiales bacterium]|nr:hypothetical protein [Parachlamydiales bacterium]
MKSALFRFSWLLAAFGCMVGPDYHPPHLDSPTQWESLNESSAAHLMTKKPLAKWWEVFKDALLDKYIRLAMENNNDLRAAESNILAARALRQIVSSKLYPQLDLDLNATRTAYSQNGLFSTLGGGAVPTVQLPRFLNLFNALFAASWEIDLFGKTRRLVEAAEAWVGRTTERKNDLIISLLAEVAENYLEVRGNQNLLALRQENVALLEKTLAIEQKRFETGYVNAFDVAQIEAELALARAAIPPLQSHIYTGIYALSVLTGQYPGAFTEEMLPIEPLPKEPAIVRVGLQSDLLRRRPDVREKERELATATAFVGVAVASFYPSFSLSADGGFQSLAIKELFQKNSKTWSLGTDLLMPLFRGGRLVGQLHASEASVAAAAFAYQQTVLNALEEAETTLAVYLQDLFKINHLQHNVAWNREKVALTRRRYESGLVSLMEWLNLKRELNGVEQNLLQSRITSLVDLVSLYKALGGGWEEEE